MDLQRSLLIGAIAVLSFMLLTKWVDFADTRTAASAVENVRLSADPVTSTAELPVASAPDSAGASDDLPSVTESAAPSEAPAVKELGNSRIILVHSDVLQLAIDLAGGDIVELALPKFPAELAKPDVPFVLLEQNDTRTYIAQSGLIGANGIDKENRPTYTTAASIYRMAEGKNELVVDLLWQDDSGIKVTKRFSLTRGDYLIGVEFLVENGSEDRWQANLFGQLKRDSSPTSSAAPGGMGLNPFLGAALTQPDEHFTKFTFEKMAEEPFKATLPGGWIAMIQHYFLSAWIPDPAQSHTFSTRVTDTGFNIAGFTSPALVVEPGQRGFLRGSKRPVPTQGNIALPGAQRRLRLVVVDCPAPVLAVDENILLCRELGSGHYPFDSHGQGSFLQALRNQLQVHGEYAAGPAQDG
jgi:YidC/Oxa1 family membrane protein insertase